jgi:DNA helicase-2/ATP-dependent DNA helicase PcrA
MSTRKKPPARSLNPEQQAVVNHFRGPLRVGAVAGSGKSHALIERAANLIENHYVPPSKILLISFSVAARKEMEKRLALRVPGVKASEICRTFHSIGLDIFRSEVDPNKEWLLDTTKRLSNRAIRESSKRLGVQMESMGGGLTVKSVGHGISMAKTLMAITSRSLRKLGRIEASSKLLADSLFGQDADTFLSILHATEDVREETGVEDNGMRYRFISYDDMVYSAAMLLRQKGVGERWAHRWAYVMQDEAQDAAPAQDEIAEALCRTHRNYMVVGDPAQSIYAFRGSDPKRLLSFENVWPGATTVAMSRNYRSGIEIVDLVNSIVANMPEDQIIAKQMVCERKTHAFVGYCSYADNMVEADHIAINIKQHFDQGVPWKDQAILIRMNYMASSIEIAMAKANVPYRVISGSSFFKLPEVSMLLGYLRVALGRASVDDVEISISNPGRKIGKVFFEALAEERKSSPDTPWVELVLKVSQDTLVRGQRQGIDEWAECVQEAGRRDGIGDTPYQILSGLSADVDLHAWLRGGGDEDSQPISNLEEALSFASGYSTAAKMLDVVDGILEHRKRTATSRNVVSISTVHKSKGLEFPVVYLPCFSDGLFPSSRADLLEERRLFYVAATRAMDELWISYHLLSSDGSACYSSHFSSEVGLKITDGAPGRKIQPTKVGTQLELI